MRANGRKSRVPRHRLFKRRNAPGRGGVGEGAAQGGAEDFVQLLASAGRPTTPRAMALVAAAGRSAPSQRWVAMLALSDGDLLAELLDTLRYAGAEELRELLDSRPDPLLDVLCRACVGAPREGDPPNASESEFSRAGDVADPVPANKPVQLAGQDLHENLQEAARALGQDLYIKDYDECALLLDDLRHHHGERLGDITSWEPADWVQLGAESFYEMRKGLLRLLKALLKCASDDPECRQVLKDHGILFSGAGRRPDGRLIEPLLAYFGCSGEYGRNKSLRERRAYTRRTDVLHEHRLVAECLFYLARRTDGEWEVEQLRSLAAIIKDLIASSGDLLEFPKHWTIDEHRTERSEEDDAKMHDAELAHITSVLCVTWWEAVHRVGGRGRGGSRDLDEEKLKALVELVQQDDRAQLNGFGLVFDLLLRVGLHQYITNRTQDKERFVTDPWMHGSHDRQRQRECHSGAFKNLEDVLTCMRVKAEPEDAVEILRSLQGFMLHLVEKFVRPVVLAIGYDAEDQQGEPDPENICKLKPLLTFWAELCKCVAQSMPPDDQEWLDQARTLRALGTDQMKNFVLWGMQAFLRPDERQVGDQRHVVMNACLQPFCTVLGSYSCFEYDVAAEVFGHLYDQGWWTQQQHGQHDQNRAISPVLETFEKLEQSLAAQQQQGLLSHQRTFCIGALRLLQHLLGTLKNNSERRLDVARWMKALVGMISLETGKPPQLRVELFRTLTAFVENFGDPEIIRDLLVYIDQVNLLGPKAMPAELNKHEAADKEFPVVRAYLEMMQVLISQHTYWEHAVTRPQEDATSPLRLLNFIRDDVLAKHVSGRLYKDSGVKWSMAFAATSVLLELVKQPTDPTWMLQELKLVMKASLDSPGLVHVLRFARAHHSEGRVFEDAILVSLKFVHKVLEHRVDNIDLVGGEHADAFSYPRVMNLLGLIGYQYSSEIVLAAACILTNLSHDPKRMPLASIGLEDVRDELRQDFREAISGHRDGDFRGRPSWVVLKLLVTQARQWHSHPEMLKPALVHVMLGWPTSQDLSFGSAQKLQRTGYYTGLRVKQDSIAESERGVIADVMDRLDPNSYHALAEEEVWRETELCWELVRLLFSDPRTHHAMRSHLTADQNRQFFDEFMDTCMQCWEPLREYQGSIGEDSDQAVSLLYQASQYMQILAVELNQSAFTPSGFSVVDKLLAAARPGAGEDDVAVVTAILENMDLDNTMQEPPRLVVDDPEPARLRTYGPRGEEHWAVPQLDLWWRRMNDTGDGGLNGEHQRDEFLKLVLRHNRFRSALHAGQQNFLSWKRMAELILLHKWKGPWHHGRASHECKVRRLLAALLDRLRRWCDSVVQAEQLNLLKLVLAPVTEVVALCIAQLSQFSQGADNSDEIISRPDMLEAIIKGILSADHDSAVRGNLYSALLHLLWWCGVGRGGAATAESVQRAHLSAQQQELLERVCNILHEHVGNTGSQQRSLLVVLAVDTYAGAAVMNAAASLSRPPPWVQTLATSVLEIIVRQDWETEGRWVARLGEERLLDQILLPGADDPQIDVTLDPTPDQQAALHVLEARLTLAASLAEAPPRPDTVGNAVLSLLPRLVQSWYFVGPTYLRDHHRMRLLLDDVNTSSTSVPHSQRAVVRYHRLAVPVLRTYVNLLVSHADSIYALEQTVDFLAAAQPLIFPVLDAGASAAAQGLPSGLLLEKLGLVSSLFQRVFQACGRHCDYMEAPLPESAVLPTECSEGYTERLIEQLLFFFNSDRRQSLLVPEERARMYADIHPASQEAMQLWATELRIVRNVLSVLHLQLKYQTELQAPLPASLLRIPRFRALGSTSSSVYGEWLRITVEQLRITEALVQQRGVHSWRDGRIAAEVTTLFTIAKTLVAILFRVRDRSPSVLESLERLESIAVNTKHGSDPADVNATASADADLAYFRASRAKWAERDVKTQQGVVDVHVA